jgi:hypothetical protein
LKIAYATLTVHIQQQTWRPPLDSHHEIQGAAGRRNAGSGQYSLTANTALALHLVLVRSRHFPAGLAARLPGASPLRRQVCRMAAAAAGRASERPGNPVGHEKRGLLKSRKHLEFPLK